MSLQQIEHIEIEGGSLELERLAFDSDIFGFAVGRINECRGQGTPALSALHAAGIERAAKTGIRHLSRRVPADAYSEIAALEDTGYHLRDTGVIFSHELSDLAPGPHTDVVVADEAYVTRVVDECADVFQTSRFYHDPAFGKEGADELHRRWIWNSFRGRADAILGLSDVTAFVTCAVDAKRTGNIALFGVAPAAQGRGAGQRLIAGALAWFAERANRVLVKTQAINYRAVRMYERAGFRLFQSELTYARQIEEARV